MKSEKIRALKGEMLDQDVTPMLRESASQLVMGDGNLDADIVFIGEAPGKKEDELGVPFVGAAGRFLDEMLRQAGMDRTHVYITNIVKYRPPNNRDPLPEEIKAFWPYLLRQLELIRPKIIITLGRHSGACFIPDLKISRDHGIPHQLRFDDLAITVIPLYHPAAALYNGSMRSVLIDDFIQAAEYAAQINHRP